MKYFPVQETHISDLCNKETQLLHSTDTWRLSRGVLPVEPVWRISEGLSTGCSVPTLPSPCWPCAGEEQWCMGCGNMQPSKSIHVNSALPSTPGKSCFQTSGKGHSEWSDNNNNNNKKQPSWPSQLVLKHFKMKHSNISEVWWDQPWSMFQRLTKGERMGRGKNMSGICNF